MRLKMGEVAHSGNAGVQSAILLCLTHFSSHPLRLNPMFPNAPSASPADKLPEMILRSILLFLMPLSLMAQAQLFYVTTHSGENISTYNTVDGAGNATYVTDIVRSMSGPELLYFVHEPTVIGQIGFAVILAGLFTPCRRRDSKV